MSPTTAPPPLTTTGISSLPAHILDSHVLTRLDGQSLASATCASASLSAGQQDHRLWSKICHSTWPSTAGERLTEIISTFSDAKNGPRSFFSHSFPLPTPDPTTVSQNPHRPRLEPRQLISAVDIFYRNNPILTKTEETETTTGWFRCSPFRIDVLDPKDVVPTPIPHPDGESACTALMDDLELSWIVIDPVNKRAVNLSSHKPVSVQRHWLSREVQVRFASVLAGEEAAAVVQCGIVVNFAGSEEGMMQVREVMVEVEDMEGRHLNGRDSLVILKRAMEGKRGSGLKKEEESRQRYKRYQEMKRERIEKKSRVEGTLDSLFLAFGFSVFIGLVFIFL